LPLLLPRVFAASRHDARDQSRRVDYRDDLPGRFAEDTNRLEQ